MKRIILAAVMASGFAFVSEAQEKKEGKMDTPPATVSAAFNKSFPGSSKVKWEKEKSDYEAGFMQNGKTMSAVFDSKGSLKETEVVIKTSELPTGVQQYLKTNYKGSKIQEAAKITRANGEVLYEAEVNKKDLIFDVKGNFLKAQSE